jgi:hypothetical protein
MQKAGVGLPPALIFMDEDIRMEMTVHQKNGSRVAKVHAPGIILNEVQDALDLMATADYVHGCRKVLLHRRNLPDAFFSLKTGLAGEILQKFTNYSVQLAIVGDFSDIQSRSLRDFIRECNRGSQVFFVPSEEEALEKLHSVELP